MKVIVIDYGGTRCMPVAVRGGDTYLLDTLTALCDFVGIEAPESHEGVSFRPVLEGKKDAIRDVLYGVYNGGSKPRMRTSPLRWKPFSSPRCAARTTRGGFGASSTTTFPPSAGGMAK